MGRTLFDINHSNGSLDLSPKTKEIKPRANKWGLTWKLLHSKGNRKQNDKTTYGMEENIRKWYDQQGVNIKNLYITQQ